METSCVSPAVARGVAASSSRARAQVRVRLQRVRQLRADRDADGSDVRPDGAAADIHPDAGADVSVRRRRGRVREDGLSGSSVPLSLRCSKDSNSVDWSP